MPTKPSHFRHLISCVPAVDTGTQPDFHLFQASSLCIGPSLGRIEWELLQDSLRVSVWYWGMPVFIFSRICDTAQDSALVSPEIN